MTDIEKRTHDLERYKDFTYLDKPEKFCELMANKNYDTVQVHTAAPAEDNDIVGFCGSFSWKDNVLKSLDGDSYNQNMLVYGYSEFTSSKVVDEKCVNDEKCLDILVDNDW